MKLKCPLLSVVALIGVTIATTFAGDQFAKSKAEKATGKHTTAKAKTQSEESIPGTEAKPAPTFIPENHMMKTLVDTSLTTAITHLM